MLKPTLAELRLSNKESPTSYCAISCRTSSGGVAHAAVQTASGNARSIFISSLLFDTIIPVESYHSVRDVSSVSKQ